MSRTLPKAVRTAVNRNAYRIAKSQAYEGLRKDLEQRAHALLRQPKVTVDEVVAALNGHHVEQFSVCYQPS